ncbi:PEP-CTERM sorting domain-containing protein [Ideonella sp. DXS29W]|uniref:PEP-CTERM sorting domain-containing protein n=1 Tax=Ideonella lacteola TaxID=2984193 RepID=A0ABU9BHM1_9BURK
MKLMSRAATTALVWASSALTQAQAQAPQHELTSTRQAEAPHGVGVPDVYLNGHTHRTGDWGTSDWAQRIDFASASGMVAPAAGNTAGTTLWAASDFVFVPAPPLRPEINDPAAPALPLADAPLPLALDIASHDRWGPWSSVVAVPEPSALLMMIAGLGAIALVIRRRRGGT